jgi:Mg2+/Co2+ transporter CorB
MHLPLSTLFISLIVLVIASAFFSGSEIGMMSLNRYRLRHLVKQKNKNAIRVNQLLSKPDKLLGVILIGNTLANIVASTIATLIGQRLYGDVGVAIATISLTLIILVFSEMTPKTLAAIHPQKVAFFSSLPLKILQQILMPIVYATSWIANNLIKLCGISLSDAQHEHLTGEELRSVVHEAGVMLPIEHKSMLISLLDLEQATVEDIMIPKSEVTGLDLDLPWHDLLDQIETAQHTRLPLYHGNIDNLIGMIHIRDILHLQMDDSLTLENILEKANKPYYVPEATTLNIQLLHFQKTKQRSCFVVDEYGDLLGLATMEDILEEVVGEFTTDVAALEKDITPQEDGSYIVDGGITIRQLNRLLHWNLPLIGPRTLSGLIIEHLGTIPPANCCLRLGKYQIDILKVSDNMIRSIRMFQIKSKATPPQKK